MGRKKEEGSSKASSGPATQETEAGTRAETTIETELASASDAVPNTQPRCIVVGIGASSGGLEALERLFSHLPADSGMAYVVVQHLDPRRASSLPELLGQRTRMPVIVAQPGSLAEADHVYVTPPGALLQLRDGRFDITHSDQRPQAPIDTLFRALAADLRESAVGIILSGQGSDGTDGLRAIQAQGGLTLAQTLETAGYDAMPRSALEGGVVDRLLSVDDMPATLIDHARRMAERDVKERSSPSGDATPTDEELVGALGTISEILRKATGHDFSQYKRGTVLRRLRRRLQMRRTPSLREYIALLESDPHEPEIMSKELLIGVTQFFRDPEAFDYLAQHVLPLIISAAKDGEGIRIWVPGCASGEEAYSLGIILREKLTEIQATSKVQIFATDIDADAIAEARQARYPADIARRISPARLARFFVQDGASYQVTKEVREMCIFSEHSLIRDPPFLGLDLVSCRNLLIYLDVGLQRKLVPVFHYALKPGSYLFLGPSESLASHPELFTTVEKRFRIFKRVESLTRPTVEFPLMGHASHRAPPPAPLVNVVKPTPGQVISSAFERMMLQEYAPPGAVVNDRGDVICVAGLTGKYLQPPVGVLSTNVLDIAHASLRIELRTALHAAARSGNKVIREDVQVEVNGALKRLRLTVRPMPGLKHGGLFAVILEEHPAGTEAEPAGAPAINDERTSTIEQLESELRTTRASLRTSIEELESANEELKSSNEEMLSTNEELQSTNEELQSSQEELKSVNEELATVNAELAHKVDELGRANSDLQNLFSSTEVATLFLDREQRVTRFTPAAKELFRLIDADMGRPLSDLAPRFEALNLAEDADAVLRTLRPIERQVETVDRRAWYMLRILPYRTLEQVIVGTVVNLAEITQIKNHETERERLLNELREAHRQLGADLEASGRLLKIGSLFLREPNMVPVLGEIVEAAIAVSGADFGCVQLLDETSGDLKIVTQYGFSEWWSTFWDEACRGKGIRDTALEPGERIIVEDIERHPALAGTPIKEAHLRAGVRAFQATPLIGRRGAPIGVLSTHFRSPGKPGERALRRLDLIARQATDVIERSRTEDALRQSEERFRALVEASSQVLYRMTPDWTSMRLLHGRGFLPDTEALNRDWLKHYVPVEEQPRVLSAIQEAIRNKAIFQLEHRVIRRDGTVGWMQSRAIPIKAENGEIREWFGGASDYTARKQAELALAEANERLREADRRKNEFLGMLSHELRNPLAPIRNSLYILGHATPGSEQALRAQSIIDRQVKHMTRLIEDLLDVTRITSGKIQLQREPLELNELARRTVEDHRGAFVESQVKLEWGPSPAEVWVSGDRTRLSQVIGNFLQNAVKFTPAGGQTCVSVEAREAPRQAIVRVTDTGRGIAEEMVPRLFEAFTQADASLDRGKGGLGLGLAVSKGLIEMHGGTVRAESGGIGKGSSFTITLPLIDPPPARHAAEEVPKAARRRVLIIEDGNDAASSLKEVLELGGHTVAIASTGPEGLKKARVFRPDIVLCDIGLPRMDGYEVAQAMRAEPELAGSTLVALTGYAAPEDIAKAKSAGFDDHLAKPPSIEALERVLARTGPSQQS